jgi:hypothetical protein
MVVSEENSKYLEEISKPSILFLKLQTPFFFSSMFKPL